VSPVRTSVKEQIGRAVADETQRVEVPQPNENLRVRRTRKLLREALLELVEERGFERVTVKAITERAMVSRAAFYRGNWSKYDLVQQIFDEAMDALYGTLSENAGATPRDRWAGFFAHVAEYDRLYRALLGSRGSPWFAARMRARLADRITEHLAQGESRPSDGDLVPTLIAGMFVEAVTWWLDQDPRPAPDEIAAQTDRLAVWMLAAAGATQSARVPHPPT
jgi:AcrR family transcriptional regulator